MLIKVTEDNYRVGESHPKAKLSDVEVEQIRVLHEVGDPLGQRWGYRKLAKRFLTSKRTIRDICHYKRRWELITKLRDTEKKAVRMGW